MREISPYVILLGDVENSHVSLGINSERDTFNDSLKANNSCFKCLIALESLPFLCDYVWFFLDKVIYKLRRPKTKNSWVTKFMVELNKL